MDVLMMILIIAPSTWTSDKQPHQISIIRTTMYTCMDVQRLYSKEQRFVQVKCIQEK